MLTNWLEHWMLRAYRVDVRALALVRILFVAYLLAFLVRPITAVANYPDAFFNPPPGLPALFSGWPAYGVMVGLEIILLALLGSLLIGFQTKWAGRLLSVALLVFFSIWHSLGKIDHVVLVIVFPTVMSWSGWGNRWSVDERKNKAETVEEAWPLALLALVIGFLWATAGYYKLQAGWLATETQAAQANMVVNALLNDRPLRVGESWIVADNAFVWEVVDWATVFFELLFLPAVLMVRAFRIWIIGALAFHLTAQLFMSVDFSLYALMYLPFLAWPAIFRRTSSKGSWLARIPQWSAPLLLLAGVALLLGINIFLVPATAEVNYWRASLFIGLLLVFALACWLINWIQIRRR